MNNENESRYTVYMADGTEHTMPFEEAAEFLEKNKHLIGTRKIETRGKRRK